MEQVLLGCFVVIVALVSLAYASFAEWALHRYVMHRPVGRFTYPFETHAKTHHRLFKADASYHLHNPAIKNKIRMAWWNGAAIVLIGGMPFYVVSLLMYRHVAELGLALAITSFAVFVGYYVAYERLHWCMHWPKQRRLEQRGWFRWLNAHHILHHRYMDRNLNVVLPLADLLLGTLLTRAKRHFAQVRGPAVPDVQPKIF